MSWISDPEPHWDFWLDLDPQKTNADRKVSNRHIAFHSCRINALHPWLFSWQVFHGCPFMAVLPVIALLAWRSFDTGLYRSIMTVLLVTARLTFRSFSIAIFLSYLSRLTCWKLNKSTIYLKIPVFKVIVNHCFLWNQPFLRIKHN